MPKTSAADLPDPGALPATVSTAYAFGGPAVELAALAVERIAHPDARVRLPLGMMDRHGLVAGATGTGKTKTSSFSPSSSRAPVSPCSSPT